MPSRARPSAAPPHGTDGGWAAAGGPSFLERPAHRAWLMDHAVALLGLFGRAADPGGGFRALDAQGRPRPPGGARALHETTRAVHGFALAHRMGIPGADRIVDHGMDWLAHGHADPEHGGWLRAVDDRGPAAPLDDTKSAYGHAFVLLAAASALIAGHDRARALLDEVVAVIDARFWEDGPGAVADDLTRDWRPAADYRGQNANMHMCEALIAAHEATGHGLHLARAERIAALIVDRHARAEGWVVPEHFDAGWRLDRGHESDPVFRPGGTTPGHALEWSRLLTVLWLRGGRRHDWMPEAARALFLRACETGWDRERGGFLYTLGWDLAPLRPERYWWPAAEGIAAAAVLHAAHGEPVFEAWYRRIWSFAAAELIDPRGGWRPQAEPVGEAPLFRGRPDLYHALQACLVPLGQPTDRLIPLPR